MNTPVSFELAKLLKERGFDKETYKSFRVSINPDIKVGEPIPDKITYFRNVKESIAAPTIAEVVMWIYEKHGVWIWVSIEVGMHTIFCWQLSGENVSSNYKTNFKSPTGAYLAAIEHTLINIVK